MYYFENIKKYYNKKILIYKNTQQGILDIIYYFIEKNNIIQIEEKQLYKLKSISFIPIKNHTFLFKDTDDENIYSNSKIYNFILNNIIIKSSYEKPLYNYVYILKTNQDNKYIKINDVNQIDFSILKIMDDKNIIDISPNKTASEIEIMILLNNCKVFICSFGSSFYKNFIYLSNNCKLIIVFYNDNTLSQLNDYKDSCINVSNKYGYNYIIPWNCDLTPNIYKNAKIKYILYNDSNNNNITPELFNFTSL
jgi:hypothetical protein